MIVKVHRELIQVPLIILFSYTCSPKCHHFNKVASLGICHVAPSSLLSLRSVFFISHYPFNLIPLSQLTHFLNLAKLDIDFFVIRGHGMSWMIDKEHESHALYYLRLTPSVSCAAAASPKHFQECFGYPKFSNIKNLFQVLNPLPKTDLCIWASMLIFSKTNWKQTRFCFLYFSSRYMGTKSCILTSNIASFIHKFS